MEENKLIAKIAVFLAAIIMLLVVITTGIDMPGFLLLLLVWFAEIIAADALGSIVAGIAESLTGKDLKYSVKIVVSLIIAGIFFAMAMYEKNHYFMGYMGASLIIWFCVVPFAANAVRWTVTWHIKMIKNINDKQ